MRGGSGPKRVQLARFGTEGPRKGTLGCIEARAWWGDRCNARHRRCGLSEGAFTQSVQAILIQPSKRRPTRAAPANVTRAHGMLRRPARCATAAARGMWVPSLGAGFDGKLPSNIRQNDARATGTYYRRDRDRLGLPATELSALLIAREAADGSDASMSDWKRRGASCSRGAVVPTGAGAKRAATALCGVVDDPSATTAPSSSSASDALGRARASSNVGSDSTAFPLGAGSPVGISWWPRPGELRDRPGSSGAFTTIRE
mmetsp:Transcript_23758/g.73620  ORF Transcript_23758/g.73620 Transcript_23758/m.73620 type:complete len:259 (-) Transcript_23758:1198-1974(-)